MLTSCPCACSLLAAVQASGLVPGLPPIRTPEVANMGAAGQILLDGTAMDAMRTAKLKVRE